MKKKIFILAFICIVLVLCAVIVPITKSSNEIKSNISISMSKVIVPTDIDNPVFAHYSDYHGRYKDEYDFYTLIFYVDNQSDYYINNLTFYNTSGIDDRFIVDYQPDVPFGHVVSPESEAYIPVIVPVKKDIPKEELERLADELPDKVSISYTDKYEDEFAVKNKGAIIKIRKTDEDFSAKPYLYDLAR